MTIEITILISVISVSFAVFFGLKNMKRADKDDISKQAERNAEINVKLDNLLSMVSNMQSDMKELTSRLTKDEKDTEALFIKFGELERRVEHLEGK